MLGVVADAAVLQLSGCGTQSLSSGSDFDDVMKDPKATADEFIAAAGPTEIVRNADGSTIVLWRPFIVPESEGPDRTSADDGQT